LPTPRLAPVTMAMLPLRLNLFCSQGKFGGA
jgi:hypothetical protein